MGRKLSVIEVVGGLVLGGAVLALLYAWTRDKPQAAPANAESRKAAGEPRRWLSLRAGSALCFEREHWELFKSAAVDNHLSQLKLLLDGGKCQQTTEEMVVEFLDPVGSKEALILTPGGRGGYVFLVDTATR